MITRSITRPITSPIARPISNSGRHGRTPKPGDYLTDESRAYLVDELGNRLTA